MLLNLIIFQENYFSKQLSPIMIVTFLRIISYLCISSMNSTQAPYIFLNLLIRNEIPTDNKQKDHSDSGTKVQEYVCSFPRNLFYCSLIFIYLLFKFFVNI